MTTLLSETKESNKTGLKSTEILNFFGKCQNSLSLPIHQELLTVSSKKKKFYVVWQGHEPGIYDSWTSCQQQVKNYPGAKYKSFPSKEAAEQAYAGNYESTIQRKEKLASLPSDAPVVWQSWSVDAACSGNPGLMEYRGVDTQSGEEIFRVGPLHDGTNNIGEFLALVHALALLQRIGKPDWPIYSDSRIAIGWIKKKKCNTKLAHTSRNQKIFDLIQRAEHWLSTTSYQNPILKWPTEKWGEIRADFGRK